MGPSSPLHSVKGRSVSRPPLAVFITCLVLCASATLAMGIFIQYADLVLNPEAKGKWLSFLGRLSTVDFCVSAGGGDQEMDAESLTRLMDGGAPNSSEEVSVTVSAAVRLVGRLENFSTETVAAHGVVPIRGWTVFGDVDRPTDAVELTFAVPSDLKEGGDGNSCVVLTVPSSFLPVGTRSGVCVPSFLNKTVTRVGSLSVVNANGTEPFCKTGAFLKLLYDGTSGEEFYLSQREKWTVYLRLVHVSYFLFAVAVGLICFSLLRIKSYGSAVTFDKMPMEL